MCSPDFDEELGSDLTEVAGLLSQFSAVLAGFAFAGALLLLDRFRADPVLLRPVSVLLASFMTLLIATFLYATVAGETAGTARAATLNAITGVIFATGLLMMVNGVARMLVAARPTVPAGLLQLLVLAAPLTAMAYLDTVAIGLISTLECELLAVTSVRFGTIAVATIAVAAVTAWLWRRWDAEAHGVLAWARRRDVQDRYERIVVISIVATILLGAVVTRLPPDLAFPAWLVSLAMVGIAALLTLYTVGLRTALSAS